MHGGCILFTSLSTLLSTGWGNRLPLDYKRVRMAVPLLPLESPGATTSSLAGTALRLEGEEAVGVLWSPGPSRMSKRVTPRGRRRKTTGGLLCLPSWVCCRGGQMKYWTLRIPANPSSLSPPFFSGIN